jgi:ABC-type lipoprotein export system ATPase subunit
MIKKVKIELDPITQKIAESFDYEFNGESVFEIPKFSCPDSFNIGLIVGNSGSGKSSIIENNFKHIEDPQWNPNKSIASHFNSFEEACEKLFAVGLSSIPTMCKPYHVLSNGEKYRAYVSRVLNDYSVIDEFTSVVNRETAYGICVSINKYIKKKNLKNIVFASCHFDIIDWLQPDWVFNTNSHDFTVNGFSLESFPKLGEFSV